MAPALLPRRALIYGDSITEGTNAQLFDFTTGACTRSGLDAAASLRSWCFGFGEAVEAEVSNCAFAAQGYSTFNSLGYGGVPPLFTPGNPALTAWDKIDADHSRLPAFKARPPDYIVSAEGFNDQVCSPGWPAAAAFNCSNRGLTAAVAGWVGAVRAATSPHTQVVVVVPFGGEMRTRNLTRDAIREGFATYQAGVVAGVAVAEAVGDAGDEFATLIDLYPRSKPGLMGADASSQGPYRSGQAPGPTASSCDGTHPLAHRHAHLGAMVVAELPDPRVGH